MPITHQNGLGPSKYKLPLFTGLQQVVQSRKDNGIWRKPPTNHFCSLPLEIRDEIYAYLLKLGPNRPVRHRLDRRPQMPPLLLHGMHVQIFRVNHQIYEEAIPVMWRANQFVKISSNDPNFLVVLGQTPILGMSTGPDGAVAKFQGAILHTTITMERTLTLHLRKESEPVPALLHHRDVLLLLQDQAKAFAVLEVDVINPFDAVSGDGATPRPLGEDLVKQALTAHMEHLRGYPWILLCGAAESSVKSSLGDALRNDQYPDSDIAWQRLQEKYQAARLLGPRDPFAAAQALEHVRKAVAIWLSPARARSLLISRGRPFLEQVASLLYDVALDRLANLQVLYMYHLGLDHVRIVQNTSPLYQLKPDRKLAEIFRRLTFEDVVNTLKPGEVFDDSYQPRPDQYAKLIYYLAYAAHMSSRREDVTQAFVVLKHALSQLPEGASIVQQPGVVAARILITHELKVVEKRLQYAGLRLVDEDADARQIRFLYTR